MIVTSSPPCSKIVKKFFLPPTRLIVALDTKQYKIIINGYNFISFYKQEGTSQDG